ncbi:MAG: BNR/Asp-box repeat-containing [Bacteroidetes bacterium]|nr:MAG: BNR/Asp-box repeat-containing [Bacteroidota bacterium]
MKKTLLLSLALSVGLLAGAQQRNLSNIRKAEVRPIDQGINHTNETAVQSTYTGGEIYNRSGDLLKTNIASSSNVFGIFSYEQRVVSAQPEAGMVFFGNRAGGPLGATGNDIKVAWGANESATWSNYVITPETGFNFRYPSTVVYNPAGNTNPANMVAIVSGPFTDAAGWKGQFFGSVKLDGQNKNLTYQNNEPNIYINHLNIGLNVTKNGHAHVASQRLNGTSASYLSAGWEVLNGAFNAETSQFDWEPIVQVQPALLEDGRIDASSLVFSPDGSVGYLLGTAVDADPDYSPYGLEWPVVYKTTDNGETWEKTEPFNFSEINTFKENLYPTRADLDLVVPRWYNKWVGGNRNNGATVDIHGNLHIAGIVRSTNSVHPDSLSYFYTEEPVLIFDVFMNGDGTWNAIFVDSVRTEVVDDTNPFGMGWDQRIQMSRTSDGSKVFVTWGDTDPASWGINFETNQQPDVFTWGYDVTSNLYTLPVNVTELSEYWGENFWLHVSDMVIQNGSKYHIPVSTSVPGATQDNPLTHQYLSGVYFDESDFILLGSNDTEVPAGRLLVSQNYPNPFNGSSEVVVSLSSPAGVSLKVYNLLGQNVLEVAERRLGAGSHILSINASSLKSGVYSYVVTAGNERVTKKMIVK